MALFTLVSLGNESELDRRLDDQAAGPVRVFTFGTPRFLAGCDPRCRSAAHGAGADGMAVTRAVPDAASQGNSAVDSAYPVDLVPQGCLNPPDKPYPPG